MAENNDIVITVSGLETRFGDQLVHDGLALSVRRGEVLGIVGGSGSGKSVLLRTLIGLIQPTAGHIEILGNDLAALSPRQTQALQGRWGVLFQDGALFSSLSVAQNIDLPLSEHTNLAHELRQEIVSIKISLVGLPPEAANKYPSELSGGMRKRAGLARALALDPEILFLDEPTAGLDPIGAGNFDQLIRRLQRSLGLTVVMVTHDLDSLRAITDRIAVLVDKRVMLGTMESLMQERHPWIREYFHGPRGRAAMEAGAVRTGLPDTHGEAMGDGAD